MRHVVIGADRGLKIYRLGGEGNAQHHQRQAQAQQAKTAPQAKVGRSDIVFFVIVFGDRVFGHRQMVP